MYRIVASPHRNRVTIDFGTEYDFDEDEFERELVDAIESVRDKGGAFDLLADFSQAPVMDQQRASESERVVAWCAANGLRKSANVVGSLIHQMQVKRLSKKDDRFGYFEGINDALRWLDN